MQDKRRPGEVRDAILAVLGSRPEGASVSEIESGVLGVIGKAAPSSIRSYLRLNTPEIFRRNSRGNYSLHEFQGVTESAVTYSSAPELPSLNWPNLTVGNATIYRADCFDWLQAQPPRSVHAVVTDPPYGLVEYTVEQQTKLRSGKGGVWRLPPSYDGVMRSPLPRFTVLTPQDLQTLDDFFYRWAVLLLPILVPGANVIVASNPLLSYIVSGALVRAGLERRGELARLVMTMRGGDRPKAAHEEFKEVSVMPRSMWEPWLMFRKPIEGRVQDNLRKWKTGGFRRIGEDKPFGDVVKSSPTTKSERELAPHPSLKPQAFLRALTKGVLPLGEGIILDPFAGSGSTLAAAEAVGHTSIGVERDPVYFKTAKTSIAKLAALKVKLENYSL